jgi:peptidoglycan/xylan/chitin deacetylase (PgdA/CDA1 family)
LLIISAFIFNDSRSAGGKIIADTNPISENKNANDNLNFNSNLNSNINSNTAPANSETQITNIKIPILMYHHIRDFNNPSDQIGTNLSVTPADFATQLDTIQKQGYKTITFSNIINGDMPDKPIILTFDDGYENFYQNAYPQLKKRDMKAVSFIIVNDIGTIDYMTSDQIVEIENNGIEIGSHTLSHPNLSTASEAKAKKEIFNSKAFLEKLIGKSIISFCYPSGKYSDITEKLVKDVGYDFAVTTKGGVTRFVDPFALNRYRVNNGTSISGWIK